MVVDPVKGFWKDRDLLVTGAGGFIASHLVERLVEAGAHVRAFVRYNSRGDPGLLRLVPTETLSKVEIVAGDLRDLSALQEAMQGVSHVFHLGALISIPYSYRHPVSVVEANVIGTLNILQAGRVCRPERIIHTSSSEVYGTALRAPIDEGHPLQGQSPYAASKIGADMLAESFYRSFDLPVTTIRPFNTYGPRQSSRAVVPTIITQALKQDTVWLGNLDASRDLSYVSDTVEGFLRAGEIGGLEGQTINLGSGREVRIGDIARMVIDRIGRQFIAGNQVRIAVDPNRLRPGKSEVQRLLSDNRLAKERLGWEPKVTLEEGLALTIDWIRLHLDCFLSEEYQV